MGKRSTFPRRPRDAYDTPRAAALPLLPRLPKSFRFIEPCAGKGALIDILTEVGGTCVGAFDICPRRDDIQRCDALTLTRADVPKGTLIITNPPHERKVLHAMIGHFAALAPTWLLIDSDWKENEQAAPFFDR